MTAQRGQGPAGTAPQRRRHEFRRLEIRQVLARIRAAGLSSREWRRQCDEGRLFDQAPGPGSAGRDPRPDSFLDSTLFWSSRRDTNRISCSTGITEKEGEANELEFASSGTPQKTPGSLNRSRDGAAKPGIRRLGDYSAQEAKAEDQRGNRAAQSPTVDDGALRNPEQPAGPREIRPVPSASWPVGPGSQHPIRIWSRTALRATQGIACDLACRTSGPPFAMTRKSRAGSASNPRRPPTRPQSGLHEELRAVG